MTMLRGLTGIRNALNKMLESSVDVHRKSSVADTSGGFADSYTKVHTYPCAFHRSAFTPRERENTVRIQDYTYWDFTLPANADVVATDRLFVGTRKYEVTGGGTPSIGIYSTFTALEIL